MADETTSVNASATPPSTDRSAQPTSEQTPPSAATPNPASAAPPAGQQPKVSEEERIRRLQSQYTQQQRNLQNQLAQRDQQMAAMRQEMDQLQTKDMDDEEARAFRANKYIQNLESEVNQQRQIAAVASADMRTNQALYRMASKTGVSFDILREKYIEVGDADVVWEFAHDQAITRLTGPQIAAGQKAAQQLAAAQEATEEETAIANEKSVDLGSGQGTRKETVFQQAMRENNAVAFSKAYIDGMSRKQ